MCGIAGLALRNDQAEDSVITAMRDTLVHRGPDDGGNFLDGGIGLGHRRLSIIDLGGGHQPMFTEDGRYAIVYNGEIYNYPELRRDLEARGAHFRTNSDTEVILHLHARIGDGAIGRLNGIFAYAIWDKAEKRLLIVRDRAGIKPVYYAETPRGIAFGSEIKALFRSGLIAPSLNAHHIAEYLLYRQVAGDENLFAGVKVVPPGHTLEIRDGKVVKLTRYWSAEERPAPFTGSFAAAVDALDVALNAAVKRQLMADVPLGTFCSGGIDSSLTSAIAARHSGRKINTFSVGFHEAAYDESEYAREAAKACGSTHHELRIDEREYTELLPKLIWHHDLPINFANSVHIYAVSKLARQHVTVVLTGEGADELFGGYPRYYIPRLLGLVKRVPSFLRSPAFALLAKAPDSRLRKLSHFARQDEHDALLYNCTGTDPAIVRRALGTSTMPTFEYREAILRNAKAAGLDPVSALATLDFKTYLVSILNRQDKMSMATSIEARVPFLDNEIIDFARSLPLEYKQTFKHRKRVLKEVALRYLPDTIVHRRKSGFGVPLAPWFAARGPMGKLLEETLATPGITGALDAKALQALLQEHRDGKADNSELLWGVLNLGLWRQQFAL
jgi:asparagine synthase (glutamine-hydrolysing)